MKNNRPTIAIVGRPNVGKSSLFNAILKKRVAIVHEESGVTRDRIVVPATWHKKHFQLVDTGGLGVFTDEHKKVNLWDLAIRQQVDAAIEGADLLLFVTDVRDGVVPLDCEISERLRNSGKKCILVVNKADNETFENDAVEFSVLGFDELFPVSSLHNRGIKSLLNHILDDILDTEPDESETVPFRIAVVGRPNVGKSSLTNGLIGEDRVMVSETAGTTRDSVDIEFILKCDDQLIPSILIDTAGLRKKTKVNSPVERFSMMRTESAIKRSQLVIFIIDASDKGVTAQDRRIARMIIDEGKGVVIAANKWDNCKGKKQTQVSEEIYDNLPFLKYAPLVFTCALSGYNFGRLLDTVAEVRGQMELNIPTAMLNQVINDAVTHASPPVVGRKPLKIYYATTIGSEPPHFLLFVNDPEFCSKNYLGYLSNYLRKRFGLTGLPIRINLKKRPRKK